MGTSKESILTLKAGTIPSLWEDGEENQLAGAAQAVPAALLPTASPPPHLPARRLPLPATASLRCGLPAQDHRCQGLAGGGRSGVGPLALALTPVVDLARPRGRELLPRRWAKVST